MKVLGFRASRIVGVLVLCVAVAGALFAYRRHRRRERNKPPPTQRELVQAAAEARPGDPWPRGEGHVLLSFAGTREYDKGYHEPGGSFSPTVGSFGIAIWVVDASGKLLTTSDAIPLHDVTQRLAYDGALDAPPSIVSETSHYRARWSANAPGDFSLEVTPKQNQLALAVRSVGPAGGPVRHLEFLGDSLRVSRRWSIELETPATGVTLGQEPSEPDPSWLAPGETADLGSVVSPSGWAYARLSFPAAIKLRVRDQRPLPERTLAGLPIAPQLTLELPDARFVDSLNAQASHLLMSLVGDQARPGEPINYPLPWLRDGAYTAVALSRAGYPEIARHMVAQFAERDFFGGFGSEGDAMGFALWVMDEIGQRAGDPQLDRWLYPHAFRKAAFIRTMMEATQSIRVDPVEGPIVPVLRDDPWMSKDIDLVCDKAKDGLIIGRMDGHRPVLFINAVSYMGLRRAARIAERAHDPVSAKRWRERASELRGAWRRGLDTPERSNDRTAISTLWPSFVGHDARKEFEALLEQRWREQRDEGGAYKGVREWTYFDAAEMHNWLMLGRTEKVWTSLEHYWKNQQSSPGLYTWSEGTGEENSFGLWRDVRGWIAPKHVTPHYWSASEMLLLQLDMLAYVEESEDTPSYVVGAGVPKSWLGAPMSVKGVGTSRGTVDWSYREGVLHVLLHGEQLPVRAGGAFTGLEPQLEVTTDAAE